MHPLLHPLFIKYIEYFNGERDYFECHEVLEEYWKEVDPGNKDHPLVAWIQLATGLYHWRRNNFSGAKRMLEKSHLKMFRQQGSEFFAGIDLEHLLSDISRSLKAVEKREAFIPFKLQLSTSFFGDGVDTAILDEKFREAESKSLIHKHMRRDRSHILQERQANLEARKRDRS
ncbi:DUF309 domain-containing protein [Chungangia koreensis]|uniref:DUF309 domain-containing protein n=1 Tax=Chungangia koreensis TaxID=752657 RepID=A0ABV8X4Z6_9LACT